ncbi:MAG: energy-coupling factor ABC transporter ATP-binding protein [Actinomycetia bacterium]|nr:energy-coupling factor ABC transporter ATP-binding protein [Actinomycetes bacterium]
MSLIAAQGWGWRYAGRPAWAVRDLDLAIEPGERVLLLGSSGAGKSTLLAALAGVLGGADEGTEAGRLLIDGRHPTRRVGRAGLVQQDPASQIVLARVGDDVAFGPENLGVPREAIWPRVRHALDEVGLRVGLDRPTEQLSGGQQQRLVLAGALAMQGGAIDATRRPGLLLLDEPTANLDPDGVAEVRAAVGRIVENRATTLVVVEHRVEVWLDLIDRVVVLGTDGGVAADGPPKQVFAAHGRELADAGVWVPGVPLPLAPRAAATARHDAAPALRGTGLTIGYRPGEPVREHMDVTIPAGVSTVVTGPNGAGKSTLALTLAGLLPALAGRVEAGPALVPPPANRRQRRLSPAALADPHAWTSAQLLTRLGTVFQEPDHQFVTASVREELAVGLRALRWDAGAVDTRVDELLDRLHLGALAGVNPFTLSGGEKRRLSVGTVLAAGPSVIILDEPTFGQDRTTWCDLVRLIASLLDEGRTVVSVTHDRAFLALLGEHRLDLEALP